MKQEAIDFIKSLGGKTFPLVSFRPGASYSDPFGLTERYKIINNEYVWGYPGIHSGFDRGKSNTIIDRYKNPVVCPLDFVSSGIVDDGGKMYGTIISLHHRLGFTIRICHMRPLELPPDVYKKLLAKEGFTKGTLLGSASDYGMSQGIHTHTEVDSYDINVNKYTETSEFLDSLLKELYEDSESEMNDDEILAIYKASTLTSSWDKETVMKDFASVKSNRGISFINRYKYKFRLGNNIFTRYSSKLLFDM